MDISTSTLIAAIVVAIYLLAVLGYWLFAKAIHRIDHLEATGDIDGAYLFALRLLKIITVSGIGLVFRSALLHILFRLSRLAEQQDSLDLAIEFAKRAATPRQNAGIRVAALQRVATLLRKQDQNEAAIQVENEAMAIPNDKAEKFAGSFSPMTTEIQHCQMLIQQGRFTRALRIIDDSLPVANPMNTVYLRRQRGTVLRFLGRYDEAIANYDGLAEMFAPLRKETIRYGFTYGTARRISGKVYTDLYISEVLSLIGLCLKAGQIGAATEHWEKLYGQTATDAVYSYYVAMNAWLCVAVGDPEKARRLIREAENAPAPRFPGDTSKSAQEYILAQTYIALHEYESAAQKLSGLIEEMHSPSYQASYRVALADCYLKMERTDQARELYEQVIAAGFAEAEFTKKAQEQLLFLSMQTMTYHSQHIQVRQNGFFFEILTRELIHCRYYFYHPNPHCNLAILSITLLRYPTCHNQQKRKDLLTETISVCYDTCYLAIHPSKMQTRNTSICA